MHQTRMLFSLDSQMEFRVLCMPLAIRPTVCLQLAMFSEEWESVSTNVLLRLLVSLVHHQHVRVCSSHIQVVN